MRVRRLLTSATVAVALVPLATGPANAAPPDNDEYAGAIPVNLGDTVTQDTSEATTNAGDDTLNENCGAPFTNASVWYTYTPDTDTKTLINAGESDFGAGLMVFKGTPTADSLRTCGPEAVGLNAKAGKTYYIMVFSDNEVNGGNMVLSLSEAPTPKVHVTVDKSGLAFHGGAGAARVHGTYRCTHADFAFVGALLTQRAGRLKIKGESDTLARCNGKTHHWSARVVSPVGYYAAGKTKVKAVAIACGPLECRRDVADRRVQLRWGKGAGSAAEPTHRTLRAHTTAWSGRHWPTQ